MAIKKTVKENALSGLDQESAVAIRNILAQTKGDQKDVTTIIKESVAFVFGLYRTFPGERLGDICFLNGSDHDFSEGDKHTLFNDSRFLDDESRKHVYTLSGYFIELQPVKEREDGTYLFGFQDDPRKAMGGEYTLLGIGSEGFLRIRVICDPDHVGNGSTSPYRSRHKARKLIVNEVKVEALVELKGLDWVVDVLDRCLEESRKKSQGLLAAIDSNCLVLSLLGMLGPTVSS